jgi:TPP-dependent trihydroxycyclohexane-1,2-dione (THcHDO) dehydratase
MSQGSSVGDTVQADGSAGYRALSERAVHRDRWRRVRLCGGGFGIFGHGNVPCLGEALYDVQDILPLYRGQNEQSMGFAAAAYAKYHLRQRFMFCTASAGPGTANLLTAAAWRTPTVCRC